VREDERMNASVARAGRPSTAFVILLGSLTMLSPFATDTYVPALAAVQADFGASQVQVQQTLSVYLLGLAIMSLWHGAISDAVGRRPVMLAGVAVYTLASFGCALASSIEMLLGFRLLAGLAGGVGMILMRAIVRDSADGPAAQRLLANVMLLFSFAPAIAAILGGWLLGWFGWRGIFGFLALAGAILLAWAWRALPETLPRAQRQSLHPFKLARGYAEVFRTPAFYALSIVSAAAFQLFMQYIGAAHPFMVTHLGFTATQFGWMFIPIVIGYVLGSAWSGRTAGRWSARRAALVAMVPIFIATTWNVLWHTFFPPHPVASLAPLLVASIGVGLITPAAQILVIELFPTRRGLASSCQACAQLVVTTLTVGVIAIALSGSALQLALGQFGWSVAILAGWLAYEGLLRRASRAARRTMISRD